MATHYKIEKPDGTIEEVESTKIILTITNKENVQIEIPAFATHHIMSLHPMPLLICPAETVAISS